VTLANGTLIAQTDGSFVYAPSMPDFTGDETFTYQITDTSTGITSTGIVTIHVV
jgi:hypothetical protein